MKNVTALVAVIAVAAGILAGCGSSGSSSGAGTTAAGSSGQGGNANAGVAAAQKTVENYEGEQPVEKLPKLREVPAKGTQLDIVSCPLPACQLSLQGAGEAAKKLGWDPKTIVPELTPESYVARFNEIVAHPPEALVFLSAFPDETVKSQLAALEEAGVPMVQLTPQKASEKPSTGIPSVLVSQPTFEKGGAIAAAKVIADSEGSGNAAVVLDPAFGTTVATAEGWEDELTKSCPECQSSQIEISLNAPASQTLSKVISYLRQNPDTKYVFFTIASMASGFPGELTSAGLSDVKYITLTPEKADLALIANGEEWASVINETTSVGYRAVDSLARQLQGESVGPEAYPTGWFALLTEDNVPSELPSPPGFPQNFYEAWGIEG